MKTLLIFCFVGVSLIGFGQKHDYVWLFGYSFDDNSQDSIWGTSVIDFNQSPPRVYYDGDKKLDFLGSGMCMSDSEGNFLFSSNGVWIENHANQSMQNDNILNLFEPISIPQTSIAIPLKNTSNKFLFLHLTLDFFPNPLGGKDLHYSIIDMNQNNGLGKVTELNNIIFSDTLDVGKLTMTKHANGEDWWIILRKFNSNKHFITFFDGENFEVKTQDIGLPTFRGWGQACFSPDGSKYINAVSISDEKGRYFDLYDFDRCAGKLSNHIQVHSNRPGISGGAAFSPNSRFLYIGSYDKIFQYDTWDSDVVGSETLVAEYDGYLDTLVSSNGSVFISATPFFFMQLAPDGQIYINTPGSTRTLHVIEAPNEKGIACQVKQHAVDLPTSNLTMPTFPNYRLGALENSPCDTLTTTAAKSIQTNQKITLYPNPTSGNITIDFKTPTAAAGKFLFYDLTGKKLNSHSFSAGERAVDFDLTDLTRGMYFYEIQIGDLFIKTGKLVIEK